MTGRTNDSNSKRSRLSARHYKQRTVPRGYTTRNARNFTKLHIPVDSKLSKVVILCDQNIAKPTSWAAITFAGE